ncbi:MAG: hypothetical protein NTX03_05990 [Bacteroidetes bacterium]|nr:hypothetical protein [Bacteroidota bacterium]
MSHRSSHTHCQVAQADTQAKTWQRVCLPHPEKIELKKFPFPSENKKYPTAQPNDRQKSVAKQTPKSLTVKRFNYSVDRDQLVTRVWQKWRFSAPQTHLWLIKHWFSASTFVVKIATFAKPETVSGHAWATVQT